MGKGKRVRALRFSERFGPDEKVDLRTAPVAPGATIPYSKLGHKKSKAPVAGRCWLCAEQTTLLLSHAIPRWAYRGWAGSGGGVALTWNREQASTVQDGAKFYLLCRRCEQFLGEGESLLRRLHYDTDETLRQHGLSIDTLPSGLLRIGGERLPVLHRALVGIAFKALITHERQTVGVSARLGELRAALQADDYHELSAPMALRIIGETAARPDAEERVVFGSTLRVFRMTLGLVHWSVPLVRHNPQTSATDWMLFEHEVASEDVQKQLWIDGDDLDIEAMVRRATARAVSHGERGAEAPARRTGDPTV